LDAKIAPQGVSIAREFTAIVSSGGRWPLVTTRATPGRVLICSAEDDPNNTIRPRLEAAGADLKRCHFVYGVARPSTAGRVRRHAFSLDEHLLQLGAALVKWGDASLIVIDPMTAFLGKVNSHNYADVHSALTPLIRLASKHRVAVVGVTHLRKSVGGSPISRIIGSIGFPAVARAVYLVASDPSDPQRRLMLPVKNNLGDDSTGFAFRVRLKGVPGGRQSSRVRWEPELVAITASEAMGRNTASKGSELEEAMDFLADFLAAGPMPVSLGHVKRIVAKLRNDELHGIVCVNMFGEGFNLPNLKIAAVHSPHKSLAVTLQFIGRFARAGQTDSRCALIQLPVS
jgi:putative DNA primase/helicase